MNPPLPGYYENVPFADYLKWDAFSHSGVRPIMKSPKHYKHYLLNDEKTEAMIMGSLVDCLILEPEEYTKTFVVKPRTYTDAKTGEEKKWNMNAKVCKETYSQLIESGREIISVKDLDTAEAIKESVLSHPEARQLIERGKHQVSAVWVDADTGVTCKCRYDNYHDESLDDLKTTTDASPDFFSRHMNQFNYHVQGAMYSDAHTNLSGGQVLPFNLIVAESVEPYCTAVYNIDPDSLFKGRDIYKRAMRIYAECKERDEWPGYSQFVEPIQIPAWALEKDYDDDLLNG